jgi:biotin carboxylase
VDEFEIEGIATNLDLHRRILRSPRFVASDVSTGFMEDFLLEP